MEKKIRINNDQIEKLDNLCRNNYKSVKVEITAISQDNNIGMDISNITITGDKHEIIQLLLEVDIVQ